MPKYWLTFRIAQVGNYDERYQSLHEAVMELAGPKWWTEPTSFYAFNSALDIDGVASVVKEQIDARYDVALIGRIGFKAYRLVGGNDDDAFEFFPELQRA